ncbi:DB module family protein [Brugia pahangi]
MCILSSAVLYIFVKFVFGEDLSLMEGAFEFDCSRIPATYCCTARVRTVCETRCSNIHCDSDFYRQDKKMKQLIVRPETIYKNGLNDGDTANLRGDSEMERSSQKSLSRNVLKKRYLPAPTNSNENESLIGMSSSEDDKATEDVVPFVTAAISSSNSDLDSSNTLNPQSLLTGVQEGLQRQHWGIRSFKIIYHVTPSLNWLHNRNFMGSNSSLAKLNKAECGTAPHFSPCMSISQANIQFEQCCRNKMLPTSCQHSCKYNVKESEINKIIGAGFCAILHIIPIAQCASNGRDNSECCKYRQVATKSAPQCEIFCRSGQEIARVGLEHLVCRKAMNEIIACHLSGLRN